MLEENKNQGRPAPQYRDPVPEQPPRRKRKKKKNQALRRRVGYVVRRSLLVLLTLVLLVAVALVVVLNHIFNGPYPEAQKVLVMSLEEASATKWIAPLFMG